MANTTFSGPVRSENGFIDIVKDSLGNVITSMKLEQYTATVTVEDSVLPTAATQNLTVQLDASGNATFSQNLTVTGVTTLNGNLVLGDAAADTLTIGATLQGASPLIFEGATANNYETTFKESDLSR